MIVGAAGAGAAGTGSSDEASSCDEVVIACWTDADGGGVESMESADDAAWAGPAQAVLARFGCGTKSTASDGAVVGAGALDRGGTTSVSDGDGGVLFPDGTGELVVMPRNGKLDSSKMTCRDVRTRCEVRSKQR